MAKLGSRASWGGNYCQDLTETTSLTPADSGKVFFLNSSTEFTVTLPSVADAGAGFNCKFMVKAAPDGADYVISEKAASDTNVIIVNGINELETDTNDDGVSNTGCTFINFKDGVAIAGDWVELLCDGTNWYATGQTKADGGVTAT
jgi:hypothetical protein